MLEATIICLSQNYIFSHKETTELWPKSFYKYSFWMAEESLNSCPPTNCLNWEYIGNSLHNPRRVWSSISDGTCSSCPLGSFHCWCIPVQRALSCVLLCTVVPALSQHGALLPPTAPGWQWTPFSNHTSSSLCGSFVNSEHFSVSMAFEGPTDSCLRVCLKCSRKTGKWSDPMAKSNNKPIVVIGSVLLFYKFLQTFLPRLVSETGRDNVNHMFKNIL